MFKPVDLPTLHKLQDIASRVRGMIHERAIAEYHLAFGQNAKRGNHLNMCVIHSSLMSLEQGKPWREVNYSHMKRANWLCQQSFKPGDLVTAWYHRKSKA